MSAKQLSLLITGLSMALVVSLLYTIQLGGQQEDEYVIEMNLEENLEELIEEEKERLEELQSQLNPTSHRAFNETADPNAGDPEPFKTLEELEQELSELQSEEGESADVTQQDEAYQEYLKKLAERRKELQDQLGEREAKKKERTSFLKDKRTTISYSLVDRNHVYLDPPVYKCIEGGKVVINIVVDSQGKVLEARFNSNSSTSDNGCLVDEAITYALRSSFEKSSKPKQIGSITYLFQGKY